MEQSFSKCCDMFLEHIKKYSLREHEQIKLEHMAYQKGIINKENYLKLCRTREDKICTLNILAYNFKKLSLYGDDFEKYTQLMQNVMASIS
mgnify:FL=1